MITELCYILEAFLFHKYEISSIAISQAVVNQAYDLLYAAIGKNVIIG